MIHIIQKGSYRRLITNKYTIQCSSCKTIFTCTDADFHEEIVGHGMSDLVIHCPACGKFMGKSLLREKIGGTIHELA